MLANISVFENIQKCDNSSNLFVFNDTSQFIRIFDSFKKEVEHTYKQLSEITDKEERREKAIDTVYRDLRDKMNDVAKDDTQEYLLRSDDSWMYEPKRVDDVYYEMYRDISHQIIKAASDIFGKKSNIFFQLENNDGWMQDMITDGINEAMDDYKHENYVDEDEDEDDVFEPEVEPESIDQRSKPDTDTELPTWML
jgi:hypothetical protein